MKRDGIIGLDVLRVLGTRLDLVTNRLFVGEEEEFSLADVRLCAFSTEQPRKMSSEERNSGTGHPENRMNPSEPQTPPSQTFASRTANVPVLDVQTEQNVEIQRSISDDRRFMEAVLPCCVVVELKSILVTRGKIVDDQRGEILKKEIAKTVLAEPGEVGVKGIYTARSVSKVFGSSEIVDNKRIRKTREVLKKTPDGSYGDTCGKRDPGEMTLLYSECVAGGSEIRIISAESAESVKASRENAYCVIQLANTSDEIIRLQAGMAVAVIEELGDGETDFGEGEDAS
jgi:hypothetical protein